MLEKIKLGIMKISDDEKTIEIINHPIFDEGERYPFSMLSHLIHSAKYEKDTK